MTANHRVDVTLVVAAAVLLVTLPFVTTLDDLMAAVAMRAGLAGPLDVVAPAEGRLAAALLGLVGVPAGVDGSRVVLLGARGGTLEISWNCVGWQSLLLLVVSLLVGLRGAYTAPARVQTALVGLLGTILVNLARIAAVGLVAAHLGRLPAVIVHDYGGTLLVLGWLFAFWAFAQRWLLGDPDPDEAG